jgi:hypothetical protein
MKTLKKKKVEAIKWPTLWTRIKIQMPLTPLLFNTPLKVPAKEKKLLNRKKNYQTAKEEVN